MHDRIDNYTDIQPSPVSPERGEGFRLLTISLAIVAIGVWMVFGASD